MVSSSRQTQINDRMYDRSLLFIQSGLDKLALTYKPVVTRKASRRRRQAWKSVMHPSPLHYRHRAAIDERKIERETMDSSDMRHTTSDLVSDNDSEGGSSRETSPFPETQHSSSPSIDIDDLVPAWEYLNIGDSSQRFPHWLDMMSCRCVVDPPCKVSMMPASGEYRLRPVAWDEEEDVDMIDNDKDFDF